MGVGKDDSIDVRGSDGEGLPVSEAIGLETLEEHTIHEHAGAVRGDEEPRSCDRAGGPEKRDLYQRCRVWESGRESVYETPYVRR